jgi:hypothetical protein
MKRFFLLVAFAMLAIPAMASASGPVGTYTATFTINLTNNPNNHTYNVSVSCADGSYTGTGSDSIPGITPNGETVSGVLNSTSNNGTGHYVDPNPFSPYSFSYAMTSSDGGTNYSGTVSDGGPVVYPATGTVSNSTQATSCRMFPAVTSKQQCKDGGYKNVSRANDTPFKNQGDCVSYVENGK